MEHCHEVEDSPHVLMGGSPPKYYLDAYYHLRLKRKLGTKVYQGRCLELLM